jgi:hypothetical protein
MLSGANVFETSGIQEDETQAPSISPSGCDNGCIGLKTAECSFREAQLLAARGLPRALTKSPDCVDSSKTTCLGGPKVLESMSLARPQHSRIVHLPSKPDAAGSSRAAPAVSLYRQE